MLGKMASREKINTVAIVCIAAAASLIAASAIYRHRRSRKSAVGRRCRSEFEEKPQNRFKRVLADNSYSSFKHYKRAGREKEISLKLHPYEEEITTVMEQPSATIEFLASHEHSATCDSYVWINTKEQLEILARLLGKERAFAVDTEQHSVRSFLGFTALLQISTQKEDFLLDTIALHDAMGILRPVFADPSICKVVKAYFGGREISPEDLEKALLVSMSPHEIRRLEKKKKKKEGLNLRRYKECSFHDLSKTSSVQTKEYDSNLNNAVRNPKESSEDADANGIDNGQTSMNDIDVDPLPRANEDTSSVDGIDQSSDSVESLSMECNFNNGCENPSDRTGGNNQSSRSQVPSSKRAKKLSLLGHGPHGKQVVEHLLNNYGEDGIS